MSGSSALLAHTSLTRLNEAKKTDLAQQKTIANGRAKTPPDACARSSAWGHTPIPQSRTSSTAACHGRPAQPSKWARWRGGTGGSMPPPPLPAEFESASVQRTPQPRAVVLLLYVTAVRFLSPAQKQPPSPASPLQKRPSESGSLFFRGASKKLRTTRKEAARAKPTHTQPAAPSAHDLIVWG